MYGTVGRLQVKPGKLEELTQIVRDLETVAGVRASALVGKDDSATSYCWTIVWDNKESHDANGDRPEFPALYERLLATLATEPEWHSGEMAYAWQG